MTARSTVHEVRPSTLVRSNSAASQEPDRYRGIVHPDRIGVYGELSAVFAHELAQPLSAILRNAEAALQIALPEAAVQVEMQDILRDIITDAARAAEMIERLRSLFTRGAVQCQPVDLNQVIRDVLAWQQSDLSQLNVSANAELAEHDSIVLGDRVQLQQVVLNLVMNACEAMSNTPQRERRLTIATCPADDDEYIECSVTDAGHGIPAHFLERIFQPHITTKCHGLGLGLAICRSIIEAHGGRLWAENANGSGAVFHFTAKRTL
jgi:C4-dicarboxylate-specific signal transduction histidine kinase